MNAVTPPEPVDVSDLQEREKAGTYCRFEIPTEKTLRKIALVMGTDFREFCRTSRLQKPALKCMSKLFQDAGKYLHAGLQAGQLRGRGQGHQTVRRADRHVARQKLSDFLPVFARLPDCYRQDDSPC